MARDATVPGLAPDVETLLRAHGITAPEIAFSHNGYSGARITRIEQGGRRYVLKRVRVEEDWIMRVVGDKESREAQIAASSLPAQLPASIGMPTLGASHDGDGWALLMSDIVSLLLPDSGIVPNETLDRVLAAMADLHTTFWDAEIHQTTVTFLAARDWLRIVSPTTGDTLVREGRDFGLARGWRLFDELAPAAASVLARRLFADMTPLIDLLAPLPQALLHGDFKFGNVGIDSDRVWLIDWAGAMRAPVAVELTWFLAVNSSRLPCSLDETIERYRNTLKDRLGQQRLSAAAWETQFHALAIIGLLMYGWGKALDAEAGRPDEFRWWCARAVDAARDLGWN